MDDRAALPREVLGDGAYEALAHSSEAMRPAAMAAYAFEQIDRARAQLPAQQT